MSVVRQYVYKAGTTVLGGQDLINLDYFKIPFEASIVVDIVSGDASWGIEFTVYDINHTDYEPLDPDDIRWLSDASFPQGQSTAGIFKLSTAVTAIRLNLTALTGEVRFTVIQGLGV
jgi:hypothetical protein